MANPAKRKGDEGELDVQELLVRLIGDYRIRRALGAGRQDDVGDMHNVAHTAIQVGRRKSIARAIYEKGPAESERQRKNKRVPFAASFLRADRGEWIVVLSPAQWVKLWRYAVIGWRWSHREGTALAITYDPTRMTPRDDHQRRVDGSAHRQRDPQARDHLGEARQQRPGDRHAGR